MKASLTHDQGKITSHQYSTCAAYMTTIYLTLGSNLGDRLANLRTAIAALPPAVTVLVESPVYETPPWGVAEDGDEQPVPICSGTKGYSFPNPAWTED
jgi:hypothetical protein